MFKPLIILIVSTIFLSGCYGGMNVDKMKPYIQIVTPEETNSQQLNINGQYPIVFFFQGSGGGNARAWKWAFWFMDQGIASAIIDSMGARNRDNLYGAEYASDIKSAMAIAETDTRLDLSRYALMGFSRGGTMALKSKPYIDPVYHLPSFVFSLYPGWNGKCPNRYKEETNVHIFYGDLDDSGSYGGTRSVCKSMANRRKNTKFHLLKGAHHGYDGNSNITFRCCGRKFTKRTNDIAIEETRKIIIKQIKKWRP